MRHGQTCDGFVHLELRYALQFEAEYLLLIPHDLLLHFSIIILQILMELFPLN